MLLRKRSCIVLMPCLGSPCHWSCHVLSLTSDLGGVVFSSCLFVFSFGSCRTLWFLILALSVLLCPGSYLVLPFYQDQDQNNFENTTPRPRPIPIHDTPHRSKANANPMQRNAKQRDATHHSQPTSSKTAAGPPSVHSLTVRMWKNVLCLFFCLNSS